MTLPIRARIALLSGVLVGGLSLGLAGAVYLRLEADLRDSADDGLQARAETLIDAPPTGSTITVDASDVGDIFAQLVAGDGTVVASTPGLPATEALSGDVLQGLDGPRFAEMQVQSADEPVLARVLAMPAVDGRILVVGVAFDDQRDALNRLLSLSGIVAAVAIVVAGGIGWIVAGAALRPVERMRLESEAISGSEPGRRLAIPGTRDELATLGLSLNRMLDRLEDAVERERRFVADASHELRTPLGNLKAELDLALSRSHTPEELIAALRSASEETDRLTRLAADLLLLASAEAAGVPIHREAVDLGALVRESVDGFSGRAKSLGIVLEANAPDGVTCLVDPGRMRQAIGDLVDNALQHTPSGGRVSIVAFHGDGRCRIAVADTGEGFVPAFLPDAFEAFTRADASRSRAIGGAGLGLAIVRAIAEAHGGTVEARNGEAGGAVVTLSVPV